MVGEIRDIETAEIAIKARTDRAHGAVDPAHQ
jgi:Tfp pilus assembly pilus retraction ATPase PilT